MGVYCHYVIMYLSKWYSQNTPAVTDWRHDRCHSCQVSPIPLQSNRSSSSHI